MMSSGPSSAVRRSLFGRLLANKYAHDLRTLPAAVREARGVEGWGGVWRVLRERTLDRAYRRGHLLVVEQDLTSAPDIPSPPGVRIGLLEEGNLPALAGITTPFRIERMRRALQRGRTGLVAWREGRPVGWTWISGRLEPDLETHPLPLPPGAAYLWDLYVVPRERSRGLGSALAAARVRAARERGFHTGWRAIAPDNVPSLRTLARTTAGDARVVGEVRYLKLLRRTRSRFIPVLPGGRSLPPPARTESSAP
jgi:GNAT superfamily N-acetyltransferase